MDIDVYADGHGGKDFSVSFAKYIEENHTRDLFADTRLSIVDSKSQVLVQLADFLVGTTAKLYEGKSTSEFREKYLDFLKIKRIRIDEWPPRFEIYHPVAKVSELDATVCAISFQAAASFLDAVTNSDDAELLIQHATLSYLLFCARFRHDTDFIATQEIIDHLSAHGFVDVNRHYLRSNVVSRLRDRDVIIASSSRGYKIPTSYLDLVGFGELVDGIVSPLLARLKRAHNVFELGSAGRVRLLDEAQFKKLQRMLNSFEEEKD
jgi:hypothetical protein